jgi:hypothetical protein
MTKKPGDMESLRYQLLALKDQESGTAGRWGYQIACVADKLVYSILVIKPVARRIRNTSSSIAKTTTQEL